MSTSTNDQAGPAIGVRVITPSNTVDIDPPPRSFHVSVAGDIKITDFNGNDVTVPSVPVGIWPVRARRIWIDGTTATVTIGYD